MRVHYWYVFVFGFHGEYLFNMYNKWLFSFKKVLCLYSIGNDKTQAINIFVRVWHVYWWHVLEYSKIYHIDFLKIWWIEFFYIMLLQYFVVDHFLLIFMILDLNLFFRFILSGFRILGSRRSLPRGMLCTALLSTTGVAQLGPSGVKPFIFNIYQYIFKCINR